MGFWDFLGLGGTESDSASGLLDDLGLNSVLQAGDYLDNEYNPLPVSTPMPSRALAPMPVASRLPMIAAGPVSLSMRFPALYTFLMSQRQRGIAVSAEKMWTMLKKFGPVFLGGLMGAQALNELMMYQATRKRRRMNSLNAKALSRATRRLCSFQNRAAKVSSVLGQLAGGSRRSKRRHCFKCKRSPCAC